MQLQNPLFHSLDPFVVGMQADSSRSIDGRPNIVGDFPRMSCGVWDTEEAEDEEGQWGEEGLFRGLW